MSDSQALTEFDMVTVQGQTGLSASESETVTSYTVSAAAADLSIVITVHKTERLIATTYSAQPGEAQTIFFTTILQNPDDV